ncbi:MFS transporter [Candidatus Tisiphia endosymbiont of Nedyus quadrimaculatus]|uniref:MFS transporter n=1 Tax=Candidatus Tisiphia endosymbiont of Nedyus quadrimaculatus TaxID=3139332 RepID=UPI00345EC252
MLGNYKEQISLTKEQKEAVGLLSIGSFLEYFDLMLYVHMAILMNELFFPKTDPHTTNLLAATAVCSTFVLRPIGALIFGWIGDNIGRKTTVVITTFMMAISCFIIAVLPTYEQIGATAAWLMTMCRIMQGVSSMGEVVGAKLYLTELIQKSPMQYFVVALIMVSVSLGGVCALAIASLFTSYGFNWRMAFLVGTGIAMIGAIARTALRETPEFADAKRRIKKTFEEFTINTKSLVANPVIQEKVSKKTAISYFFMELGQPVWFYFIYIYCSNSMKNSFNFDAGQVIHHNFLVSMVDLLVVITLTFLAYKVHPLKILKTQSIIFFGLVLVYPLLLNNINTVQGIFIIQALTAVFAPSTFPANPIFYRAFPIFKRFSYASFTFAISRALMSVVTSFGIVYLIEYLGNYGLLVVMLPIITLYGIGLLHFINLEKVTGSYDSTVT